MFRAEIHLLISSLGPLGINLTSLQGLIGCRNGKIVGLSPLNPVFAIYKVWILDKLLDFL